MSRLHHINCGTLLVPTYPTVVCHCLALQEGDEVVLVDTGIGLHDVRDPVGRLGQPLIDAAGFQFNEDDTAVKRLGSLGVDPEQVRHVVLTHADPDHAGGLADFPNAEVHIAARELASVESGHWRYVANQFAHGPRWRTYGEGDIPTDWFGLPSWRVQTSLKTDIQLVPLPGHTLGHCGVAIQQGEGWLFHAGDAYYLRAELTEPNHPVAALAAARADDDALRVECLHHLRRIATGYAGEVEIFGYHDITELPRHCVDWE